MTKSLIQIEGGEVWDFYEKFGFIYMDADERTAPDEKEDAVSSYAEEPGEHRDGRTVDAPFDYTARFLVEAEGSDADNVNKKIAAFNNAVRETIPDSDVKRKREIAFYNLNNRCKIVGTAEVIAVPKEAQYAHRAGLADYADIELKIRVSDPGKCDFLIDSQSSPLPSRPQPKLTVTLEGRGEDVAVTLSRPLEENEHVTLLRRGSTKKPKNRMAIWPGNDLKNYVKRKYRWQVYSHYFDNATGAAAWWPFSIGDDGILRHYDLGNILWQYSINPNCPWMISIIKSSGSRLYTGIDKGVTFGVAVYRTANNTRTRYERVSNVAYFKSVWQDGKTVVKT